MALRMGPLTTMVGSQPALEQVQPSSLMTSWSPMPSAMAMSSGIMVGVQPAITPLMAIFSTVALPFMGARVATTWSRGRSVPRHISATASSVGGLMGVPLVQPWA